MLVPSGTLWIIQSGSLLQNKLAKNATQRNDGKSFGFKFDKENAPRLASREWAKLLYLLNLRGSLLVDPKLLSRIVKADVVEVVRRDRPFQLLAEVFDQ